MDNMDEWMNEYELGNEYLIEWMNEYELEWMNEYELEWEWEWMG